MKRYILYPNKGALPSCIKPLRLNNAPKLGDRAKNVTTKTAPEWLVRVFALFKPSFKDIAGQLGRNKKASNEKAKKLPGWAPGSHEEAILASAEMETDFYNIKCKELLLILL